MLQKKRLKEKIESTQLSEGQLTKQLIYEFEHETQSYSKYSHTLRGYSEQFHPRHRVFAIKVILCAGSTSVIEKEEIDNVYSQIMQFTSKDGAMVKKEFIAGLGLTSMDQLERDRQKMPLFQTARDIDEPLSGMQDGKFGLIDLNEGREKPAPASEQKIRIFTKVLRIIRL